MSNIETTRFSVPWRRIGRGLLCAFLIASATPALAQPTQEEVLRSISSSVSESQTSGVTLLLLFTAAVLLIVLLMVTQNRERRQAAPKTLNHGGKLLKEVSKALDLKPPQVRRLKALAEQREVQNPLVLLLCPSLLGPAKDREKAASETQP